MWNALRSVELAAYEAGGEIDWASLVARALNQEEAE